MAKICPTALTILLTLTMCNSKEKIGTYQLKTEKGNSIIILYPDSTFIERKTSDAFDEKCVGHWQFVHPKDSIIETRTESCGTMIFTLLPTRVLKIIKGNLLEIKDHPSPTKK